MSAPSLQPPAIYPDLVWPGVALLLLALWLLWRAWRERQRDGLAWPGQAVSWLVGLADTAREEGRWLLMPLGRASVAGNQAADSEAAIIIARQGSMLDGAAAGEAPVPGTCAVVAGDPTLWLTSYWQDGAACFVGPDSATYAAGVRGLSLNLAEALPGPGATVPYGAFGDEFLLFAEPASWEGRTRAPAAATPTTVLPFLLCTYSYSALGAELYEAAALADRELSPGGWRSFNSLYLILALVILLATLVNLILSAAN